jgi:putative transposase
MAQRDPVITPHALYESLGRNPAARAEAYRAMFTDELDEATLERIRMSTHRGWGLGDDDFRARISAKTGRRASPLPKGKPAETPDVEPAEPFL